MQIYTLEGFLPFVPVFFSGTYLGNRFFALNTRMICVLSSFFSRVYLCFTRAALFSHASFFFFFFFPNVFTYFTWGIKTFFSRCFLFLLTSMFLSLPCLGCCCRCPKAVSLSSLGRRTGYRMRKKTKTLRGDGRCGWVCCGGTNQRRV